MLLSDYRRVDRNLKFSSVMPNRLIVVVLAAVAVFSQSASGQTTLTGGRGLLRVQSARTIQAGSFILNSFLLSYFNDDTQRSLGDDHTWNLGLTYGLSDRLELTAQVVPYQDDQLHSWGPPGDTRLGIKWTTPWSGKRVQTGLQGFVRLPTAKNHNVPFEPFSSGKVAIGAMGLMSVDIPGSVPVKLNINLGYLDHNIETFFSNESIDQILIGAGFKIPIRAIIFYSEYTAEVFNTTAVDFRHNSMRLTHGFKFRVPFDLVLDVGADIGFSEKLERYPAPLHEYANWKIFAGLSYHFLTGQVWHGISGSRLRESRGDAQRLQELRSQRERVDETLQQMLDELQRERTNKDDEN